MVSKHEIRIAIIEDFKLTRMGLKSSLEEYDEMKVVGEAEDAETGLNLVECVKPDIVLMDLGLPGMNGIEATYYIKQKRPDVKVIILTSHDNEQEVLAALGSGADAYCLKNTNINILVTAIKEVYRGAAWIDPLIAKAILKLLPQPKLDNVIPIKEKEERTQLTEREVEVLSLLVDGKSNIEIADTLIVSVHTAKAHVCNILQKLKVSDRVQAAVKAVREDLI